MKKRKTGHGGAPRKLLAILVSSVMMSSGAHANDVYMDLIVTGKQVKVY